MHHSSVSRLYRNFLFLTGNTGCSGYKEYKKSCLPAIALAQARPPAKQVRRTGEAGGLILLILSKEFRRSEANFLSLLSLCGLILKHSIRQKG
jgi:hypothetical protein